MIHATKGIVLRTVKYGETSVIAGIFTELFGIRSYIVNGVRTQSKTSKAHFFQPASLLEMEVYNNELKNLQRIKDLKWSYLYKHLFSNVIKNSVALYMVELLQKCLKHPESNADLFNFCEDAFMYLDTAGSDVTGNFPIFFAIHLAQFSGLRLLDNYSKDTLYFSISEGIFINTHVQHDYVLDENLSYYTSQLLKAQHPDELKEIRLNKGIRTAILAALEKFFMFHIPEFGAMKTLPVLHELLS